MNTQRMKEEKDKSQEDCLDSNNLLTVSSLSKSQQIDSGKQNNQNMTDQQQNNKYEKYFRVFMVGVIAVSTVAKLKNRSWRHFIAYSTGLIVSNYLYTQYQKVQYQLKKKDYEQFIGLSDFEKYVGRGYTKDEFDEKINRYLLFEDVNKQITEALKQNALNRQKQFKEAKEFIYMHYGWGK